MLPIIISRVALVLALLLALPATAILATWNTLPGQPLYPLKRNLEKTTALFLSPSYAASSELEIKLVSRRLGETEKTIDQSSSAGLKELIDQAQSARSQVLNTKDTKAQSENSAKLAQQLRAAQETLHTKKATITSPSSKTKPSPTPTPKSTVINITNITKIIYKDDTPPQPDPTPPTQPSTPTQPITPPPIKNQPPAPAQTPAELIQEIEHAQAELETIIDNLETKSPSLNSRSTQTIPSNNNSEKRTRTTSQPSPTASPPPQTDTPPSSPELTPPGENL